MRSVETGKIFERRSPTVLVRGAPPAWIPSAWLRSVASSYRVAFVFVPDVIAVTAAYSQAKHGTPDSSSQKILQELRTHAHAIKEAGAGAGVIQALGFGRRWD